jgi:cytochrome P450
MSMAGPGPPVEEFDPFSGLDNTVVGAVRDPYPDLAEKRRTAPVELVTDAFGTRVMVYRHEDVCRVLRDAEYFSSKVYEDLMGLLMGHTILEMDQPEHRLHRHLVSHAFRQKVLAHWEETLVGSVVNELVDRFADLGRADLVRQVTFPFPVKVIAGILGLPPDDYVQFQRWSLELISVALDFDRAVAASQALKEYFGPIVAQRRRQPEADLISDLAAAELDGEQLSDEEIFAFLRLLLPAGVETTYRSSGNLLYGLLTHPDQLEAVRADRSLVPQAIEEGLRWEPPLLTIARVVAKDTVLGGVPLEAGTHVAPNLGAANRDETRYQRPDEFDIFRDPKQHIAFGFGPHMCLGMHLARMETRVALNALLDRLPDLRPDPEAVDVHIHGDVFRSPTSLPVLFG